jgi:hypothetical protein
MTPKTAGEAAYAAFYGADAKFWDAFSIGGKSNWNNAAKAARDFEEPYFEPNWDTITPEENDRNTCEVARRYFKSRRRLEVEHRKITELAWMKIETGPVGFYNHSQYRIAPEKRKVNVRLHFWFCPRLNDLVIIRPDANQHPSSDWKFLHEEERDFEV